MPHTLLDAILASLDAAGVYNPNDQVAPAAILWTDKDRQWERLTPSLRQALPQFLTLGPYDPATRTGPAIWLKCMIARRLPEAVWPAETIPILYLPGVSRQELRAVEECPRSLQPLAELQYRSVYWTQLNARDWTLLAFLQSKDGGLGLDVARDAATQEAMHRALLILAETPLSTLQDRRLETADFNALLTPDPMRDLLTWLNDPPGTRERWDKSAWGAFRSVCREQLSFDPETDGDLVGAERLGGVYGMWKAVWDRFAEAPKRYPHLPDLLRKACPTSSRDLFVSEASPTWPQDNEGMESELRTALFRLDEKTPADAAATITTLEMQHSGRRDWVWAELGYAPLARALRHLVTLAEVTRHALGGSTLDEMAQVYTEAGWRADEAVLDSLACVRTSEDVNAVCTAIRILYTPWLDDAAIRFQTLIHDHPLPGLPGASSSATTPLTEHGTVLLFADGLRFDVGQKLKSALLTDGCAVEGRWRWVATPSVTPTAKPAVSPIADLLKADSAADEFRPYVAATGKPLTIDRFRQLLLDRGYQVLSSQETGDPKGSAWTELGDVDSYGHTQGWKLAWRVEEVVHELKDRIVSLLEAGWNTVHVVTDHGWLLLPGGLPKTEMPAYLTDTRWGRCAVLKETSVVDTLVVSWYWSPHVRMAMAPGISVFKNGLEYAHGGLSVQECVAVELIVTQQATSTVHATITAVEWFGLRCRVRVDGAGVDMRVDIRTKAADPSTSIATPKPVSEKGPTPLFVEDDQWEGAAAVVVLLTADGQVISKHSTTVGE